ncbi:serine/threonine protein kinase [bacterium]|nr:serine/threonine protein kinase [bacterium]
MNHTVKNIVLVKDIKSVRDSYDREHTIAEELGRGGQGAVCRTANPEIVVKFVLENDCVVSKEKSPELFARNDSEFKSILQKPFPDRLHLAYPMARLQDYSGYLMRLMGDMTSFEHLVPFDEESIGKMAEDGGHRRRFELLAKLAAILAKIHGSGMVYCDISPNNVYVTEEPLSGIQNVWLIDADNIFIPGEEQDKIVYTPRYAAPELVSGKTYCSMNSDIYSFAVLAFESLAALHPFDGDGGEEDNWDSDTDENDGNAAGADSLYSGSKPWVEDPENSSNHTGKGLPRQNFLTEETFRLFNMTFSEEGRNSPGTRPPAVLWARAFARSHAASVRCQKCGMSFVYDGSQKRCQWCDEKLPDIFLLKNESGKIVFARELSEKFDFGLPEHLFSQFDTDSFFRTVLSIHSFDESDAVEFRTVRRNLSEHHFFISADGREEQILNRYILKLEKRGKYSLRCKNNSGSECRLDIELRRGNKK